MRRFSSYGPINDENHYYAPRKELIAKGYSLLIGDNPGAGGHYFTVWAPRQCGKTWVMQEVVQRIKQTGLYDAAIISLERAKDCSNEAEVMSILVEKLQNAFERSLPPIKKISELHHVFSKKYFRKPVILACDEFDAIEESFISRFAGIFRELYIERTNERDKPSGEKTCLLHGLALIGIRGVLGIENVKGSPFNVQRSLRIPNLTFDEVKGMFQWYEKESLQTVEPAVVENLFSETNGQPGLTCWFGELLSEGFEHYTNDSSKPITMREFEIVYAAATVALPNNNILNLISKAKIEPNKTLILKMFRTDLKLEFKFDDSTMNAMYMNGVVEYEIEDMTHYYIKFSCPFVQKRLFNYFSGLYFNEPGMLIEPFTSLDGVITETSLNIIELFKFYQVYLDTNKNWLFKNAPRRSDQRVFEAVFHFSIYSYLNEFLRGKHVSVMPEFPTGNGKIDILIRYGDKKYGIELKSFRDSTAYKNALEKAAHYGKQLGVKEIFLVSFIESIDEETRSTYEKVYTDTGLGVTVRPFFIKTGVL